jgi:GT2 family glycosyltransferase
MPNSADPVLTVIIVSYNVARDLRECLASVYASRFSGGLQVIVVDNASDDDTVSSVRREFPEVELVCNPSNVGFPKANNQALALARGTFILFLNPDTEVMADTMAACVAYLREHPDVGLLGCQVRYPDGTIQYECARNYPSLDAMLWEALYLHMLFPRNRMFGKTRMSYWDHQGSREIPCLLGAFMLTRHSILADIGGMDESVFMFMEDIDLCYRIHHAGWKVFYLADYSIIHKVGRSQKSYQGSLRSTNAEAKYAFFRKHSGPVAASACRLIFLMESIFRLTVSVLLFPIVTAFPGAKEPLRRSWAINDHWQLLRWALGYGSGPQAAQ